MPNFTGICFTQQYDLKIKKNNKQYKQIDNIFDNMFIISSQTVNIFFTIPGRRRIFKRFGCTV